MRRLTSVIIIGLSCVTLMPTGRASAEQKINTDSIFASFRELILI